MLQKSVVLVMVEMLRYVEIPLDEVILQAFGAGVRAGVGPFDSDQ